MEIQKEREAMRRGSIRLEIQGAEEGTAVGKTRFGGLPDLPPNFPWPVFETNTYDDDEVKPRPLAFLAQFDCAEMAPMDKDGLLPKTGVLSFFYEMDSMRWGFDPKDAGCARVFWFEDVSVLSPTEAPAALEDDYRFPALHITAKKEVSLPGYEDFFLEREWEEGQYDEFMAQAEPDEEDELSVSKLLGWPDVIQNCIAVECELVSRGYYLGSGWKHIPEEEIQSARRTSLNEWRLLFQLDTVEADGFELMFGDCGRIYFYIRKEDLEACRFDRVWLIQQCY